MAKPTIVLMGTCDTKWDELCFTQSQLLTHNTCDVLLMDIGRTPSHHSSIAIKHPDLNCTDNDTKISDLPRPEYIHRMTTHAITALTTLHRTGSIHAVLGIGGSCGTALATAAMRSALPVGFPKLMVSTMASGDVSPYVEETDITLMYSVVDVAGTNRILNRILTNAAAAVTGMAVSYASQAQSMQTGRKDSKMQIAITMFGVTTPAVNTIRERLQQTLDCEVYVFHATGAGGNAMERLIREGQLDAVVDLTTTEIPDEIVGGVLSAGPRRLIAAAEAGLPQIISVGACDMVNFGPRETVPARFRDSNRLLYEHNPTVTLMRTTPDECKRIGRFMAEKLKAHVAHPERVRVILPAAGISMLDTPGQPFHDREADEALFSTLENELEGTGIAVLRDSREINDPEFAISVADSLADLLRASNKLRMCHTG
ncbi:hypothetical protein CNMCM8980_008860 [Aspergillus fumigatiaffinis]|uniref:Uncharacterized protein n=1 Tax=Aspergillus fumigatiaffinis TaxID=340414 RepID=A0A8H4H5C2_9EURO|nr:hypothetical protein CNMCM5878_008543 [Aspergillus fumigatiaffinis]KAF4235506.1 hypothetical protein CNMCM6805_007940 [Aspergillus fumigatiaffinis]KAF4246146.1 hypothetical protein CNMCM8980_008860 [Aspergillus fumigatiaffinis]